MMTLRALAAFLVVPGTFGFLLPLAIAQLDPFRSTNLGGGVVITVVGALILLWCVRDFYISGKGTLAPWDPPKQRVVVGLYRYVRNPCTSASYFWFSVGLWSSALRSLPRTRSYSRLVSICEASWPRNRGWPGNSELPGSITRRLFRAGSRG